LFAGNGKLWMHTSQRTTVCSNLVQHLRER
jgi:hypothetical protein